MTEPFAADIPFAEADIPLAREAAPLDEAPPPSGGRSPPAEGLRLAVVLCARDRASALLATLESVWRQTELPHELIIMDDGQLSPDAWESIAVRCTALGIDWKYEVNDPPGPVRARNRAAHLAESEVLLYLSDDVSCGERCIEELRRIMADATVAAASAAVESPEAGGLWQRLLGRMAARPGDAAGRLGGRAPSNGEPRPAGAGAESATLTLRALGGAATALRRSVVLEHSFDETLADDVSAEHELGARLASSHRLLEARQARVVRRHSDEATADRRRRGHAFAYNRLYVAARTRQGLPGRLRAAWELASAATGHVARGVAENRPAHFAEARGMLKGALDWRERVRRERLSRVQAARRRAKQAARAGSANGGNALSGRCVVFLVDGGEAGQRLVEAIGRLPQFGLTPVVASFGHRDAVREACRRHGIECCAAGAGGPGAAAALAIWRLCAARRAAALVVACDGATAALNGLAAGRWSRTPVAICPPVRSESRRQDVGALCRFLYRCADALFAMDGGQKRALAVVEKLPAARMVTLSPWSDADAAVAGARPTAGPNTSAGNGTDRAASLAAALNAMAVGRRSRDWRKARLALRGAMTVGAGSAIHAARP